MNIKRFSTVLITLLMLTAPVYAEYVFKKDGSIIKGTIIKDETSSLVVKTESGSTERISRDNITRVLYSDLYIGKVYVRLTSGEVLEGYQVDEDRENYVFRKDINKPDEFTLPRKKVMFIARTNPTDLKSEGSINNIVIRWSPPFKPAKSYKVYTRENKKNEKFTLAGETDNTSYNLKELPRCTSYEVYVIAIDDDGVESLPSEKIIAYTLPYSPEDLTLTEKLSNDNKTVTLTLTWKPVTDKESRVKSYTIYKTDAGERKKLGTVTGNEFVINDFSADGRHWFTVVAVNDLGTESKDVRVEYDAGYKIYTSISAGYLVPLGDLGTLSEAGYAGLVNFSIGIRQFSFGFETGYMYFSGVNDDLKSMGIVPVLLTADYRFPLFLTLSVKPVIKAGFGYNMTEYIKHDITDPLITTTVSKSEFNPMVSGELFLDFGITDYINVFGGAGYGAFFEKGGTMSFVSFSLGAAVIF